MTAGRAMEILVATDFSELANDAMRVAAAYAKRLDARVHVLHVTWPDATAATMMHLENLGRAVFGDAIVVTAVRIGSPASKILEYADTHDIDLIVLGTHGRTGISHALTGSVAERVVRTASCPVMTVPQRRRPAPEKERVVEATVDARGCIVCGGDVDDLICEACRARIRGEALEKKWSEEKAGHTF
jgi:nucleotide-binding universal stress UspA family protein